MPRLLEAGGKRLPFLRWSFLRLMLGIKHVTTEWQVGDGREEALERWCELEGLPARALRLVGYDEEEGE